MTVFNFGTGPATIGNIVVNLQKRVGKKWVTASSDIADATQGDDATSANIHKAASSEGKSTFSENSASGPLEFMDATNNTIFSLVPQVTIGAGQSRSLLFQASFDNNVLNIPTGALIRAEVIVSFGNATANGKSTANVDINGNGQIDSDEARIRSVATRITAAVPAPVNGNGTVTLSDTLDDITSTGTVTFSNVDINLGATSGTVTATVDGGTDGGSITNCAHLTSPSSTVNSGGFVFPLINGLDLESCSTVLVAGVDPPCTPGAAGCGWRVGDLVTFDQGQWGAPTNPGAALLTSSYFTVYSSGILSLGISGTSGFSMVFTSAAAVINYLPSLGVPGSLTSDVLNPTSTSSGVFGGEAVGLTLNTDFTALTGGSSGVDLGSVTLCNFSAQPLLNGRTVDALLADINSVLGGGGSSTYGAAVLSPIAQEINNAFLLGQPSAWAQTHLFNGACPTI